MCGIAGIVAVDRTRSRRAGARGADARRHHASRSGRSGPALRRARRARPSPPQHRRSRAPASSRCRTKTAASGWSSTARSTTTPTSARELEAHGHVYRTQSDTETIVHAYEQWGDDCVAPVPRHVRVRDLGRAEAAAAAGARSPRHQAALLGTRRRHAAVRIGDQGDPRQRSDRAGAEPRGAAGAAQHALHRPARTRCSAASTSCCRGTCSSSRTATSRRGSTGTCPTLGRAAAHGAGAPAPSRRRRRVPRAARGIGSPAPDERRAARHVPLRRHRQQRDRRDHGAA